VREFDPKHLESTINYRYRKVSTLRKFFNVEGAFRQLIPKERGRIMNKQELDEFEVFYERCCGLDVHKKQITACLITPDTDGRPQKEVRTFGAMTEYLLALHDWLTANQCTHEAMESTGVYWKPVYNVLEGSFHLLLVNAQHIKAVPGRKKTDKLDAKWLARLLRVGLLKGSFLPAPEIRELKDLVRHRTTLIRDKARAVQRLQKILEDAYEVWH